MISTSQRFPLLTVQAALVALRDQYQMERRMFVLEFPPRSRDVQVGEALEDWPASWLGCLAHKFGPLRFYGGPPSKGRWYFGSVATLYYDAILFRHALQTCSRSPVILS